MEKTYVLFIVIQEHYKIKTVLEVLEKLGITGATVLDTMGAASLAIPMYNMYDATSPMVDLALAANFNKTIFSVVKGENTVIKAMDKVEEIIVGESNKTGKGIMFTVPLVGQMGIL